MKRIMIALATLAAALTMTAADVVPDAEALRRFAAQTQNYTTVADRYARGERLSQHDMALLYYGSPLSADYRHSGNYTSIDQAMRSADYRQALALAELGLESDPASLALLTRAYAAAIHLRSDRASALQQRIVQLCDLIFATGKGVVPASPFVVASSDDIAEFTDQYLQPRSISGTSRLGDLTAVKVTIDGVPGEVIFYFRTGAAQSAGADK